MFEIKGLDQLSRQIDDARKPLAEAEANLGSVEFDLHGPTSIEPAIRKGSALVDHRLQLFSDNPILVPLVAELKETLRNGIIESAARSRAKGNR
jgi:hypothetical protein